MSRFISEISLTRFLSMADASLDEALAFLRRVVLGVLAEIAELARALDLLRQLRLQLALELMNLVFELLENPRFHRGECVAGRRAADANS